MLTFLELIDLSFPLKILQNVLNHVVALSVIKESIVWSQFLLLWLSFPFFFLGEGCVDQYFAQARALGLSL